LDQANRTLKIALTTLETIIVHIPEGELRASFVDVLMFGSLPS
jgi:hypothetical protein